MPTHHAMIVAPTGGVRHRVACDGRDATFQTRSAGAIVHGFGDKLGLVLKALTLSNGRVAAELAVDKSLVGRWVAGTVRPSSHNLGRLTALLAQRLPGLTLLDWDRTIAELRARVEGKADAAVAAATPSAIAAWLAQPKVGEVAAATAREGAGIAGIWRSTRLAPDMPGRFCHDYSIIEPRADGPLSCRSGVFSARLSGWAIVVGDQVYCCSASHGLGTMTFTILNRVRQPRVDAMDGISMACSAVAGGVPMALAFYMERVGILGPDPAENDSRFEAFLLQHPLAPEGSVPDNLRRHLVRDIGPTAHAEGGDLILMMRSMTSLARGGSLDSPAGKLRAVG